MQKIWTLEEDEIIKNKYSQCDLNELSRLLGRTKVSIKSHARILKIKYKKIWTEDEIKIIQNIYPKYGPKYCSILLKLEENVVSRKAKQMNIKKIGLAKHPSRQKVNPEQFYNITSPEVAYFLGYFWADGNIIQKDYGWGLGSKISMEIVSEDANDIKHILEKIGSWSMNPRKRNKKWKETTKIATSSKDLYKFLSENDYDKKSNLEPTKILSKISEELKPYWWRGFFDGDGTLVFNERGLGKKSHSKMLGVCFNI